MPDRRQWEVIAVEETELETDGDSYWVSAAVDVETFELLHVDASPEQSALEVVLFLKEVLNHCRGRPVVNADRGPWYDRALEQLPCDGRRETVGGRSLIEAWFGVLKGRTRLFCHRFPHHATPASTRRWLRTYAALNDATL